MPGGSADGDQAGTRFGDWIFGTHGVNAILGKGGDDVLRGEGGDDTLLGRPPFAEDPHPGPLAAPAGGGPRRPASLALRTGGARPCLGPRTPCRPLARRA